ncbi:MAG: helix-turn-helix domain-containing protein [Gammaproteobacteria bacterium]|nr:helix-turn-helix domain-containing protein [Gammaproteobacteria bacterium]
MRAQEPAQSGAEDEVRPSLGDFLRARRDRLRPEDLGFPRGRRRAPGLRREEAAQLCGISPTWYTWIEQGRATAVSVETLSAIASGLHLSRAERAYLFELGARADPAPPRGEGSDPQQLAGLVRAVRSPAYVLDRHWDAIAWNRPAAELFVDWLGSGARPSLEHARPRDAAAERNLLRYVFLDDRAPGFIVDWGERARRLVAEYRADMASRRDDPVGKAFVHELCAASSDFESAWRSQQVLSREGGLRSFQHPKRGSCAYEQYTLRVAQWPELKMTMLLPGDSAPARD